MKIHGSATLYLAIALAGILAAAAHAQTPAVTSTDARATGQANPTPPPPPVSPTGPDFPRGRISGYTFGDVYLNVDGDPRHAYNAAGADSGKVNLDASGQPITRDLNGVQLRRIYFQLDNDLSIRFSTRFRLELDGKALTSDGKIGAYLKNGYIQARNVYPRADFFFGMIDTPTWQLSEDFWAYRSIEKTIADFRGLASSSDIGIALRGYADPDHRFGYTLMVGDGLGQKPEDNRYKRTYLALPVRFSDFRFEPYADYEDGPAGTDRATYKLFAGVEPPHAAIGVEILDRVNHGPAGNIEPRGLSLFCRLSPKPTFGAFARVDFWETDRRASNRVDSRLWIAGLDWHPLTDVHIMPNFEMQEYVAKGTAVAPAHRDLQARVTFYYRYSRPQS